MIYGLTIDRTDRFSAQLAALSRLPKRPMVRLVFDPGVEPGDYLRFCQKLKPVADIMGQFVDSESIKEYSYSQYQERVIDYVTALRDYVNVWECGNEVNGDWCGNPYQVWQKVLGAIQEVKKRGGKTVVTYYYDFEPPEDRQYEMFNWIDNHPLNPDYALLSAYENWYPGVKVNFNEVFAEFENKFPKALIGFGEFGPQPKKLSTAKKIEQIRRYYGFEFSSKNWIGGGFYWDFSVEYKVPSILKAIGDSWKK